MAIHTLTEILCAIHSVDEFKKMFSNWADIVLLIASNKTQKTSIDNSNYCLRYHKNIQFLCLSPRSIDILYNGARRFCKQCGIARGVNVDIETQAFSDSVNNNNHHGGGSSINSEYIEYNLKHNIFLQLHTHSDAIKSGRINKKSFNKKCRKISIWTSFMGFIHMANQPAINRKSTISRLSLEIEQSQQSASDPITQDKVQQMQLEVTALKQSYIDVIPLATIKKIRMLWEQFVLGRDRMRQVIDNIALIYLGLLLSGEGMTSQQLFALMGYDTNEKHLRQFDKSWYTVRSVCCPGMCTKYDLDTIRLAKSFLKRISEQYFGKAAYKQDMCACTTHLLDLMAAKTPNYFTDGTSHQYRTTRRNQNKETLINPHRNCKHTYIIRIFIQPVLMCLLWSAELYASIMGTTVSEFNTLILRIHGDVDAKCNISKEQKYVLRRYPWFATLLDDQRSCSVH
jgi:hypothetical protein